MGWGGTHCAAAVAAAAATNTCRGRWLEGVSRPVILFLHPPPRRAPLPADTGLIFIFLLVLLPFLLPLTLLHIVLRLPRRVSDYNRRLDFRLHTTTRRLYGRHTKWCAVAMCVRAAYRRARPNRIEPPAVSSSRPVVVLQIIIYYNIILCTSYVHNTFEFVAFCTLYVRRWFHRVTVRLYDVRKYECMNKK